VDEEETVSNSSSAVDFWNISLTDALRLEHDRLWIEGGNGPSRLSLRLSRRGSAGVVAE
jgi:hypothetical protein